MLGVAVILIVLICRLESSSLFIFNNIEYVHGELCSNLWHFVIVKANMITSQILQIVHE